MSIHKELSRIQKELKAPKNQRNNFGKYNYRSCEDILEALKPVLGECHVTITDEVIAVADRIYIKATARLSLESDAIEVSAMAREPVAKKGMDESQITGAASSYARKYALNGLFCIDDNKDADSNENHNQQQSAPQQPQTINQQQAAQLQQAIEAKGFNVMAACQLWKINSLMDIQAQSFNQFMQNVQSWTAQEQQQ